MKDCIFCKIIASEIPAEIVYEDEDHIAFLDINYISEGHTLLIPKNHFHFLKDCPDEVISKIFILAKELSLKLSSAFNADFVELKVVGIDVPHFHIHLIPRYLNDGLDGSYPQKQYRDEGHKKEIADKIRAL